MRFKLPSKKVHVKIHDAWFAWRPVYSSSHRMWIWLETVIRDEFASKEWDGYRLFHYQPASKEQLTGRYVVR